MSASRRGQRGLSLIELMVAVALSILLVLGLVQVFAASRASYQMAQGMARTQENGRFAMEYLQRDARMVGHLGCVNDQSRFLPSLPLVGELFLKDRKDFSTVPTVDHSQALRFDYAVQGYDAAGTAPGSTLTLAAPLVTGAAGDWSPQLPPMLQAASGEPIPVKGSDILVMRMLSPESAAIASFVPDTATFGVNISADAAQWKALKRNGEAPTLLAAADCRMALLFQATTIAENAASISIGVTVSGLNQSGLNARDQFDASLGQVRLYRADIAAYYVGLNPTSRLPSLYRMSFSSVPGSGALTRRVDEIAPGVENLQLLYGQDSSAGAAATSLPTGYINSQVTAANIKPSSSDRAGWQRVGTIKAGLLVRSPEPAVSAVPQNAPTVLGTTIVAADDQRYRAVYETSIALRNRLFGN